MRLLAHYLGSAVFDISLFESNIACCYLPRSLLRLQESGKIGHIRKKVEDTTRRVGDSIGQAHDNLVDAGKLDARTRQMKENSIAFKKDATIV